MVAVAFSAAMIMTNIYLATAEEWKRRKNVESCKHEVIYCSSQLRITSTVFFSCKLHPLEFLSQKRDVYALFCIELSDLCSKILKILKIVSS